jgi:hypothetical protein
LPVLPVRTSDDILQEIDQAHASLSPHAQDALDQAHATLGIKAPVAPTLPEGGGIKAPPLGGLPRISTPAADSVAAMRPITTPMARPSLVPPVSPAQQADQGELARLTAPAPRITGTNTPDPKLLHTKQNTGTSGINQIHSPWARIPLQILDALGAGLVPAISMSVPGTQLHHELLTHQAAGAEAQQEEERTQEAKIRLEAAQAEKDLNPPNPPKVPKADVHAIYASAVEDALERGVDPKDDPKVQQALQALTATTAKTPPEKEDAHAILAEAIRDAIKRNVDPNEDPKVQQLTKAIQNIAKPPAEKEGEMPIGDERATSTNAGIAALYREAGIPVPTAAQVTGKYTQKDEARILDLAKSEVAAHRQNQEFDQRRQDRNAQFAAAQGNHANDQLNRAYDNFDKKMTAELTPLKTQLENAQEARRLVNGGSLEQFLGTVKTLVAVAGGRGSGVRITQAELNGIPSARGVAGGFEGFVNSLSGKGKLSSDQIRQVNKALGEIEAIATAKQERLNKYMDQAVGAKSPAEIKKIEQDYRHEDLAAASGAGTGGGGQATSDLIKNAAGEQFKYKGSGDRGDIKNYDKVKK